jgi:hypothetical protein
MWDFLDDLFSDEASVARGASGQNPVATFNQSSTFAIMEFLENSDSNQIKQIWTKYKAKDVSPLWGTESTVKTFKKDKAVIDKWHDFQKQMKDVDADWFYLSGHHGREFASDNAGVAPADHQNNQKEIGFFNHVYHHHTWEKGLTGTADPLEVYMTTSNAPADATNLQYTDNPLYTRSRPAVKGVLLVGCNTLFYRNTRIALNTFFPGAVIIGLMSTESASILRISKLFEKHGKAFFDDPTTVPPADLVKQINTGKGSYDYMGVQYKNTLYACYDGKTVETMGAADLHT